MIYFIVNRLELILSVGFPVLHFICRHFWLHWWKCNLICVFFSVFKPQHGGGNRQQQQSSPGWDEDAAGWKITGTTLQFHPCFLSAVVFVSLSASRLRLCLCWKRSSFDFSHFSLSVSFFVCCGFIYPARKKDLSLLCRRANKHNTRAKRDTNTTVLSFLLRSAAVRFAFYLSFKIFMTIFTVGAQLLQIWSDVILRHWNK